MDTQTGGGTYREAVRGITGPTDARELYDAWAPTYEDDLAGRAGDDYPLPGSVADLVARLEDPHVDVLDAACGTGLLGAALARHGFSSVDGLDLSPRMLTRARARRVYHDLGPADLSTRLPGAPDKFGVLVCVNALEPGHLPAAALAGFARVVHRGGHLVLTASPAAWAGLETHVRRLATGRVARIVEQAEHPLHPSTGENHVVVVLEVLATSAPSNEPGW